MRHPRDLIAALGRPRLTTACAWIGLVALVLGALVTRAGALKPRPLPDGVSSPVFAIELMRRTDLVREIVRREPETAAIARATRLDYAFIPAYAAFFVLAGLVLLTAPSRWRLLGGAVIVASLGGAAFDLLENRAILRVLYDASWPTLPRQWSLFKWALLFVAIGCSAPVLVDRDARLLRRWMGYLGAILCVAAAVEGLYGVAAGEDVLVEAAAGRMALAFIVAELFFATRRLLQDGVLPALDRLAESRWLGWLTDWPPRRGSHRAP